MAEGGMHPNVAGLVYDAAFQPDKGSTRRSTLSVFTAKMTDPAWRHIPAGGALPMLLQLMDNQLNPEERDKILRKNVIQVFKR